MNRLVIIVLSTIFLFVSCNSKDDDYPLKTDLSSINRVLILGNSITKHSPKPEVGWVGDWGMAASSQEKDYVHILKHEFKKYSPESIVEIRTISEFERRFWEYDFSKLDSLTNFKPDILIINLGENVNEDLAVDYNFGESLNMLINHFIHVNSTKTIVADSFWPKKIVNNQIKELCEYEGYIYVSLSDLNEDEKNSAFGLFDDQGVASHPSDKGMTEIAKLILNSFNLNY
jgi:hypothetical protein